MGKQLAAITLAMALIVHSAAALADGEGFSYSRVYELLYQFESLPSDSTSHLAFRGRAIDRAGDAPTELRVRHDGEDIVVPVDEFGMFTLPMSPQLAQLNPRMVAFPPARELQLGLAILVRLPDEGVPDADWLREGVRQTNAAILARSRVHPSRVPLAHGVTLRFSPDDNASIGVIAHGKAIALEADEEGRVELPLDPDEDSEAVVSMSHRPQVIFPLF